MAARYVGLPFYDFNKLVNWYIQLFYFNVRHVPTFPISKQ